MEVSANGGRQFTGPAIVRVGLATITSGQHMEFRLTPRKLNPRNCDKQVAPLTPFEMWRLRMSCRNHDVPVAVAVCTGQVIEPFSATRNWTLTFREGLLQDGRQELGFVDGKYGHAFSPRIEHAIERASLLPSCAQVWSKDRIEL
ncbi:MAG: hypothetical protein C0465_13545 [Ralstonia sp.]|jgi:hypothetical protein|nr:hypothetical protein [Ralstonia sp.]MBA4231626.1 hypothetical protein [Ralstonia sp.]MBA4238304.1 hypothetical protein [Ralstonia sp.]MBA4402987.1 hypothetical protein [Ralstonia sp.]